MPRTHPFLTKIKNSQVYFYLKVKIVRHSPHLFVIGLGFRFFWPCGPCLAFCDLWLTTGLAYPSPPAYFKRTLKWSRIVSIAVCTFVVVLGSRFFWPCSPCLASCDLWLTTGSFLLLRRAFVSLSAASVKSVVKVVLST